MGKKMRLPNNYGSVYKLSGNRRKPYAVAITTGWDKKGRQQRKIIEYVESRTEGLKILADYHNNPITNFDYINITFKESFDKWFEMTEKENKMAQANKAVYKSVFKNHCIPLYNAKVTELKTVEIQNCIDICTKGYNTKKYIKLIASQIYKYCLIQLDLQLKRNFSQGLKIGSNVKSTIHMPFENEEIDLLWDNLNIEFVDSILLTIYTGLRPSELLKIELEKVYLKDGYMVGGLKTQAGIDRIIPIHEHIIPIIRKLLLKNNKYLIEKNGKHITYRHYEDIYQDIMKILNLKHLAHDGRHTLATELDNVEANEVCTKQILGHKINDITKGTYTHKNISQLITTINLAYKNIHPKKVY